MTRKPRSPWLSGMLIAAVSALAGCAFESPRGPDHRPMTAAEGRAFVAQLLPPNVADRTGWATDIYAAIAALEIPPTAENICAVVAVTDQESSFRADPPVPGLSGIAWKEIDRQRERVGVPKLVLQARALLQSSNGRSYSERIDAVKTEKQLSEIFEDFIGMVPLGRTFFADRNPVRTGGPMQVSIAFAEPHAAAKPYPYPVSGSIRHEVFTRRGGMYFGIAHLLDYPASLRQPHLSLRRFQRRATTRAATPLSRARSRQVSGIPLALDGDLLRYERGSPRPSPATPSSRRACSQAPRHERAADPPRPRARTSAASSRRRGSTRASSRSRTRRSGSHVPRAVLPRILLQSPKITRKLTTDWFANRVDERQRRCLARVERAAERRDMQAKM